VLPQRSTCERRCPGLGEPGPERHVRHQSSLVRHVRVDGSTGRRVVTLCRSSGPAALDGLFSSTATVPSISAIIPTASQPSSPSRLSNATAGDPTGLRVGRCFETRQRDDRILPLDHDVIVAAHRFLHEAVVPVSAASRSCRWRAWWSSIACTGVEPSCRRCMTASARTWVLFSSLCRLRSSGNCCES
jgi:hypothetical protein